MAVQIPLERLLNQDVSKYKIARAAMKLIDDLSEYNYFREKNINKPAIFSLAKVLNEEVQYEIKSKSNKNI